MKLNEKRATKSNVLFQYPNVRIGVLIIVLIIFGFWLFFFSKIQLLLAENCVNADQSITGIMTFSILNTIINLKLKKPCYSSLKINVNRKDEQLCFRTFYNFFN